MLYAFLGQLTLDVLMPVDTQLAGIRKVRAELEEERAKVPVDTVEVVIIDHGRGSNDPRMRQSCLRIAPLFSAEDVGFLLRLPDEEDAFLFRECRKMFFSDIILTLPFGKRDDGNLLLGHELGDRSYKVARNRVHQSGGGEGGAAMFAKKTDYA